MTAGSRWWRDAIVTKLQSFVIDNLAEIVTRYVPNTCVYEENQWKYLYAYSELQGRCGINVYQDAQTVFGLVEGRCVSEEVCEENPDSVNTLFTDFVQGVRHGTSQLFTDGQPVSNTSYDNGERHGPCYFYNHGKLVLSTLYEDGQFVERRTHKPTRKP